MLARTKTTIPILNPKSDSGKGHFFSRTGDSPGTFFAKKNEIQTKKNPIQRKIQIGKEGLVWARGNEDEAYQAAGETVKNEQTGPLAKWFVRYLLAKDNVEFFDDESKYSIHLDTYVEKWKQRLGDLGIKDDARMENAFWMYNKLENTDAGDEAIIYKIADQYHAFKERWIEQQKANDKDYQGKGLIYYPRAAAKASKQASESSEAPATKDNLHTMPLNFSWLAALVHHQVPVRVVVPLDDRVLIRAKDGATDMEAVKSGKAMAPLSATAREVLGLLNGGYYTVSKQQPGDRDYEIVLTPTGKPLLFPDEVAIVSEMAYMELVKELGNAGIKIQPETLVGQITPQIKAETEKIQSAMIARATQNKSTKADSNADDIMAALGQRPQGSIWKARMIAGIIIALIASFLFNRFSGNTNTH
ncbi:MAG: hypothetical protein R3D00_04420 [Bacteroidia bacterium]